MEANLLPAVWVGQRQKVAVTHLLEGITHDPLGLEAVIALAEGRMHLPPPGSAQPSLAAAVAAAALVKPPVHASEVVSASAQIDVNSGQIMQVSLPRYASVSDHAQRGTR
jgi:hypothetical protein